MRSRGDDLMSVDGGVMTAVKMHAWSSRARKHAAMEGHAQRVLAWPWYAPLGCAVSLTLGLLLARARRDEPRSEAQSSRQA